MSVTGSRLRELREETGKSQGDVAKLIGISRPAYVAYETGRSNPSRKVKELSTLFKHDGLFDEANPKNMASRIMDVFFNNVRKKLSGKI